MKSVLTCVAVLWALGFVGCVAHAPRAENNFTTADQLVVQAEVERTIRDYFTGFSKASCTDGSPVSKFARDPSLYVLETDVVSVSLADYDQGVRDRACNWQSHGGEVISVVVDALSRDVAVAAWTYHDDILLNSGVRYQTNGAVLMTLVKTGGVWKISSAKASEVPVH